MSKVIERIRQLYEANPDAQAYFRRMDGMEINYTLGGLAKIIDIDDFSIASLERLGFQRRNIARVLALLPPEVIYKELGEEVLLWTVVTYDNPGIAHDRLKKGLTKLVGTDTDLLEKARLSAWRSLRTDDYNRILAIRDVIKGVNDETVRRIDLPYLLTSCWQGESPISEKRRKDYRLVSCTTKEQSNEGYEATWGDHVRNVGDLRIWVWLDAPVGLGLMYKNLPNAVSSFLPTDEQTMMIYQLQGVQASKLNEEGVAIRDISSRGLMPIDWQKLLVEATEQIARQHRYRYLAIRSGRNNPWTVKYRDRTIHLPLERALVAYDEVAQRLGFEPRQDKNWYRQVAE